VGSVLQGSVTLASPPMPGDSTPIALSFTDPADYSPTSLMGTLMFGNGSGSNITFRFSTLTFTNLSNNATVILLVKAPAQCVVGPSNPLGVPCQATGLWQDHDPQRTSGSYSVTAADVPEPGYGMLLGVVGMGFLVGRRVRVVRKSDDSLTVAVLLGAHAGEEVEAGHGE